MMLRHACAAAALAALSAAPLEGQSRTFSMQNGMRATFVHPGTERRAFISLVLETGEIDEPAFGPGLASLTADMLLQGTVARSAQQIAAEAATLGTSVSVRAGPVTTTISGEVASARVPRFIALVADLVRHPLLDTEAFERVRRNAQRALDSTLRNATDLARQQWRAAVFPEGPFGHPYTFASTLRLLKLGHVRNVYDESYAAARAHLYVSGVFDDAATEKAVRALFSDWKAGSPPVRRPIHATAVHELVTTDLPGAARSAAWVGLPTIGPADSDFAKLEVADMLLSGDDSSRVALAIAAIDGGPPHGVSTLWQRRRVTYWAAVLDVEAAHTGAALRALIGELAVLRNTAPQDAEVERAQRRAVEAFESRRASREGAVALLEFQEEHSFDDAWIAGYAARIRAVTAEDVRRAASQYLDPARMTIAVAGDRATLDPQLAALRPSIP